MLASTNKARLRPLWGWLLVGVLCMPVIGAGCGDDPKEETTGCSNDTECPANTHCQATLRTCHECTTDAHCGEGQECRSLTCQDIEGDDMGQPDMDMSTPDMDMDVAPDAEDLGDVDVEDEPDVVDPPDMDDGGDVTPETCEPACVGLQRCDAQLLTCVEPRICLSDEDCIGENLCFNSRCLLPAEVLESGGCTDDASCDAQGEGLFCNLEGHYCTPSGRCNSDAQCPGGLACGPGGLCVECDGDDNCPGGLVCDTAQGSNICIEEDRCGGDEDCRGDRICQGGGCVEPDCAEDQFEGNQTCDGAAAISIDTTERLQICGDSCDWFAVNVGTGDGFLARVLHDPDLGDLDLALYEGPCDNGEAARRLSTSATLSVAEIVSVPRSFQDTTYYLEVCPFIGAQDGGTNEYTLDVMYIEGGYCVDDYLEQLRPNDVATRATSISLNERPVSLQYPDLQICPDAPDWYLLSLNPGDFLTVEMEFNNAFGNLDMAIFGNLPDDLFAPALDRSQGNGNGEIVTAVSPQFTDVYLAVYSPSGDQNEYQLRINVTGADQGCGDRFEPRPDEANNDSYEDATDLGALSPSRISGLRMCPPLEEGEPSDNDWYKIDVPQGMAAVFTVEYDPNLGTEINAATYTAPGGPSQGRTGSGGLLSFALVPDGGAGEVSFRLGWMGDADVAYSLEYDLRSADDLCIDDGRGNSTLESALPIALGVREERGVICPGQEPGVDWFRLDAPANNEIYAELLGNGLPLEITLHDADGQELARSQDMLLGPRAFWRSGPEDSELYLAVRGASPEASASYLLQAYSQPVNEGPACADDALESGSSDMSMDNDDFNNGRQVASGDWLRNLLLCPEDSDWYRFTVIAGSPIQITLQSHNPTMGAIKARLWDPFGPEFGGLVVDTVQSRNGTLSISLNGVDIFDGGTWTLEIFSEDTSVQWYDLQILTN